jgi:succinate dehydrogenase / fumarate reductase iron-sulfur subunit
MSQNEQRMVHVIVRRQDGPDAPSREEEFEVPYQPGMNVISILQAIRKNPVTRDGKPTTPVTWDCNCLEEVCGACTMIVNGKVCQSCAALVDRLSQPIMLEPMTKFPVVRDLMVTRQRMFDHLKKIKGWIPIDGSYDLGPGPKIDPDTQQAAYALSRCMTCGCCVEACPQVNAHSDFMGPAVISQAVYFNMHPTGKSDKAERLDAMMGAGGIADCGKAQNCVKVCPKDIPLVKSIAELGRQSTVRILQKIFGG